MNETHRNKLPFAQRIVIVTHPNGFFGRLRYGWESINLAKLTEMLQKAFDVVCVPIDELLQFQLTANDVVLYGSSDQPSVRAFYKDVLLLVDRRSRLLPRIEHLFAHENKGFQELYKQQLGIDGLHGQYLFDLDQLKTPVPFVFKTVDGAGSAGVRLVASQKELERLRRDHFRPSLKRRIITAVRLTRMGLAERSMYMYRHKGLELGVVQDFIPGLKFDYKVLVFGDKFYLLRRTNRENDFRASGSGIFNFPRTPEHDVLDFARAVFNTLDAPYISLDIARDNSGRCALIEYQAVHFGPYTLINSPGYFSHSGKGWVFAEEAAALEDEMARSIGLHLSRRTDAPAPC